MKAEGNGLLARHHVACRVVRAWRGAPVVLFRPRILSRFAKLDRGAKIADFCTIADCETTCFHRPERDDRVQKAKNLSRLPSISYAQKKVCVVAAEGKMGTLREKMGAGSAPGTGRTLEANSLAVPAHFFTHMSYHMPRANSTMFFGRFESEPPRFAGIAPLTRKMGAK